MVLHSRSCARGDFSVDLVDLQTFSQASSSGLFNGLTVKEDLKVLIVDVEESKDRSGEIAARPNENLDIDF